MQRHHNRRGNHQRERRLFQKLTRPSQTENNQSQKEERQRERKKKRVTRPERESCQERVSRGEAQTSLPIGFEAESLRVPLPKSQRQQEEGHHDREEKRPTKKESAEGDHHKQNANEHGAPALRSFEVQIVGNRAVGKDQLRPRNAAAENVCDDQVFQSPALEMLNLNRVVENDSAALRG